MAVPSSKIGSPRRAQKGLGRVARLVQFGPRRKEWVVQGSCWAGCHRYESEAQERRLDLP